MKKQHFIQVIDSNQGIIRSLCRVYYPHIEDQQDAYQDIVLQLWKSFDSYQGKSKRSTWIYSVSLNTLLTKVRKDKKAVATEPIVPSHLHMTQPMADDHVELLSMILQSLNDLDKAIVVLYLEGYGNKEMAKMLKITPSHVSTRLNRVKSQLKSKYGSSTHAAKRP